MSAGENRPKRVRGRVSRAEKPTIVGKFAEKTGKKPEVIGIKLSLNEGPENPNHEGEEVTRDFVYGFSWGAPSCPCSELLKLSPPDFCWATKVISPDFLAWTDLNPIP
jgi:hypothetical protein